MASHPRPRFFLSRPDGTIVPLIPLDELPEDIIIPGVPRTMSLAETAGMVSLGRVGPPESFYLVDSQNDIPTPVANGRGREVNNSPKNKKTRDGKDCKPGKEYCSYWIRNGECDFVQQGCRYKHEMPKDLETLNRIGLRDIPAWYREKFGVSSLLQDSHDCNKFSNVQQDWRKQGTCERRQGSMAGHESPPNDALKNGATVNPNSSLTFQQNENLAVIRHCALQNSVVSTSQHPLSGLSSFNHERHRQAANGGRPAESFSSGTRESSLPSSSPFSPSSPPSSDFGFHAPRSPFVQESLIDSRSSQITKANINEDADDTLEFLENRVRKLNELLVDSSPDDREMRARHRM